MMRKRMLCVCCILSMTFMILVGCNTKDKKGAYKVEKETNVENVSKDEIVTDGANPHGTKDSKEQEKPEYDSNKLQSKDGVVDKINDTERDYIIYTGVNLSQCIHVEEAYNIIKVISQDDEVISLCANLDDIENIIDIYDIIDDATENSKNCIYATDIGLVNINGEYLGYYDDLITKVAIGREMEEKAAKDGNELTIATYRADENYVVVSLMVPVKTDNGDLLGNILYSKSVEIMDGFNPFDSNNGEITAEQKKVNWVNEKLFECKREIEEENLVEMPFTVEIGNKDFISPFTGKELKDAGIEFNDEINIVGHGVSFGDLGTYTDGTKFELGFINNLDEDRLPTECYVASVATMGDGIKLKASVKNEDNSQENYDETSYIELGTSLEDTLKLLTELGCEIQCNPPLGVLNSYENYLTEGQSKYNRIMSDGDTWKISTRFVSTSNIDMTSSEFDVPNEFRSKNSLRINYFDIVLYGKMDGGLTSISYDYSLVDANEYSKRYKDMYE